jgi:hypothetical protein
MARTPTFACHRPNSTTLAKEEARIHGRLTDHEKITLIDCVTSSVPGSTNTPNGQSFHASVFPHYIVTGTRHIEPDERSVGAIELLIENAHFLFWDYTAFGSSLAKREGSKSIIAQLTSGTEKPPEIGEHPEILYFTGKYQILSSETTLGRIVVSHRPRFTSPSPNGLRVKNSIPIRIEFEEPLTFQGAFDRAYALLVFVDLMMGTKHRIKGSTIELAKKSKKKTILDVYQSMAPRHAGKKNSEKPHPGDVLINGGRQPDAFSAVLAAWLIRQAEWRIARFRLIQNFRKQNSYTVDRLVAAANLFDILPESAVGGLPKVSEQLANATAEAKKLFRRLPQSQERESVLGALGRVGKQNLRTKVDVEKWMKAGTTLSHPFGRYRVGYGENLANLKAKLAVGAS